MKTIVRGKNLEVSDDDRAYAERKLGRLERLLDDRSDVIVELSVERHRSMADSHIVDVSLTIDGHALRGSAAGPTHRAGIDEVVDKIERRAVDFKAKPRLRARPDEEKVILRRLADGQADASRARRIVKVKRFDIEPMFEEDALARMEELQHDFFIFVNAETERVGILYRRGDGNFGLIEPVIGGEYATGMERNEAGKRR
ncbi:MAG: ribosomal subunit interface protein [Chloroflexi bacterium]|nr:ribosomal subunit interface protein [Chloroflexota bacterium]